MSEAAFMATHLLLYLFEGRIYHARFVVIHFFYNSIS